MCRSNYSFALCFINKSPIVMLEVTLGWTCGQTQASRRTLGGMIARGCLIVIIINKRISSKGKTKTKKSQAAKLLLPGNGWRGSREETAGGIAGWNHGIVEPWRRGIVDAGEHWKNRGKTRGGYEENITKLRITFR